MHDERIRIRHLLGQVPHVAIATVNQDGSPHNTPVRGIFNTTMHLFWGSSPDSLHSQNIARDGRLFVVVFDSTEGHDGLYLAGTAKMIDDEAHIYYAFNLMASARDDMDSIERYRGNGPQRIYRFVPDQLWMHQAVKDDDGYFITDKRVPISLADIEP